MSHNFLFDTYEFIEERLEDIKQELLNNGADSISMQYAAGRIDALCVIERFLNMNIKPKLPKRLRRNIPGKNLVCTASESSPPYPK